jgi:hypothetical protein
LAATAIIAAFGIAQIIVHLVFFLHVNDSSGERWNLMALLFTVSSSLGFGLLLRSTQADIRPQPARRRAASSHSPPMTRATLTLIKKALDGQDDRS